MLGLLGLLLYVCAFGVFGCFGAEQHRVRFDNRCGHGTPHLLKDGMVLSQGEEFVSNGSFTSAIAYLQTGDCNLNGEGCTLVELTLINPSCPGCGSSVDISLIPPLAFSVSTSFSYFNGCDGQGAACTSAECISAFFYPNDNHVQVQCQEDNVDLLISFCGEPYVQTSAEAALPSASSASTGYDVSKNTTAESIEASSQSTSSAPLPTNSLLPSKKCGKIRQQRRALSETRRLANVYHKYAKNRSAF